MMERPDEVSETIIQFLESKFSFFFSFYDQIPDRHVDPADMTVKLIEVKVSKLFILNIFYFFHARQYR